MFGIFSKKGKKEKNKEEIEDKKKPVNFAAGLKKKAEELEAEHMDFITELTASHFEDDEGDEDDEVDDKGISREEMLEAVKKDGYELKDASLLNFMP